VVLFFVFLYINSVFRFILFESVLRKDVRSATAATMASAGRRILCGNLSL